MLTIIREWLAPYPILAKAAWLQLGLAAFALLAMPFDKRRILGLDPWVKPLKFDLSVLIMLVTMAAFLQGFQRFVGLRIFLAGCIAVSLSVENVLISLQSFRGVRSHMNYSTMFNARIFAVMGLGVVVTMLAIATILVLVFIGQPKWPTAVTWGVGLGLLVFLAGCAEGVLMVAHGGHTVGAADGVQGLPLVNWSTAFGDLRIAHFFALHSVQAFPLLGLLVSRCGWAERFQIGTVVVGAALYTVAVWLLFRQAMAGRPFIG